MLITIIVNGYAQKNDGPTMGWSSWNTFAININDSIIRAQADAMVTSGLSAAGYRYINIDDGFFGGRRKSDGQLLIHPKRFPNGLKPLVDYIHNRGLKAGIYSDAGRNTCGNFWGNDTIAKDVGMLGYDQQDANFFFNTLEFDFIKVDFCGGTDWTNFDKTILDERERYTAISEAIKNTGKKGIRFNVCRWDYPGTWVSDIATSWRTTHDIADDWNSVKSIIEQNLYMSAYSYKGHYNDMDMLEIGRSLTYEEDKTHFGLWCIMNSPLLIGCDMTQMKQQTLTLLKNKELIALNQDPVYEQAYIAAYTNGCYVLVKDIKQRNGKSRAFAIYNPNENDTTVCLDFRLIDMSGNVKIRDIFEHKDIGEFEGSMNVNVPAHGIRIYTAKAQQRLERSMYEAECGYISDYQEIVNNITAGTAIYVFDNKFSGGHKVSWLGRKAQNDLIWRNVYSKKGGEYTMAICYTSTGICSFNIDVNGVNVKTVRIKTSDNRAEAVVRICLKKGMNTIRLHNDTALMPDIDYMRLQYLN